MQMGRLPVISARPDRAPAAQPSFAAVCSLRSAGRPHARAVLRSAGIPVVVTRPKISWHLHSRRAAARRAKRAPAEP